VDKVVLVRYGEVALKTPYVRSFMERRLLEHIKFILDRNNVKYGEIKLISGRIFVRNVENAYEIAKIVSNIFGVVSTSPAVEVQTKLDSIREAVIEYSRKVLKDNMTFAIRARRVKKFPVKSKDLERILGADVLEALKGRNIRVNLTSPNITIYVEVRSRKTYIFHEVLEGVGGLPYGVEGKAISLVSGGIDSPVATWLIMKRGVKVIPVYFNSGKFTSEEAVEKAHKVMEILRKWVPEKEFYFYEVNYEKALNEMVKKVKPQLVCLACKRTMLKTAIKLAIKEEAKAVITGESLGQVASQTLDNMFAIGYDLKFPILRPLIGLDKEEIVKIARKIGTYNISSKAAVECKASPVFRGYKAAAHADISVISELEETVEIDELVNELVKNTRKVFI